MKPALFSSSVATAPFLPTTSGMAMSCTRVLVVVGTAGAAGALNTGAAGAAMRVVVAATSFVSLLLPNAAPTRPSPQMPATAAGISHQGMPFFFTGGNCCG